MMGLGDTQRGANSRGLNNPASRGSGRAIEFERMPPKEGRLVAVGGRSGRLSWETGPGKKV